MNILLVLTLLAVYIARVENAPLKSVDESDDRICIMWVKHPFKLLRIPCDRNKDAVAQVVHSINGNRFNIQRRKGELYYRNFAELIEELKSVARQSFLYDFLSHNPILKKAIASSIRLNRDLKDNSEIDESDEDDIAQEKDIMESADNDDDDSQESESDDGQDSAEDDSEELNSKEDDNNSSEKERVEEGVKSGRRTFGAIVPMAELALKAIGGDIGFDIPTSADLQIENQAKTQNEMLTSFRLAQERATLEALETKERLAEVQAKGEASEKRREEEITGLKELILSLKDNSEKEQSFKGYRQLVLEKDEESLQKEIADLKRKLEIDEIIKTKKLEDLGNRMEIEKSIEAGIDKEKSKEDTKKPGKCQICG